MVMFYVDWKPVVIRKSAPKKQGQSTEKFRENAQKSGYNVESVKKRSSASLLARLLERSP